MGVPDYSSHPTIGEMITSEIPPTELENNYTSQSWSEWYEQSKLHPISDTSSLLKKGRVEKLKDRTSIGRSPARKRKYPSNDLPRLLRRSPSGKTTRYCTIMDVHRANVWLLRWLLRQMVINMPYYCCTGSLYYCQRSLTDIKWLLKMLLRLTLWQDPRKFMLSRKQLQYFCHSTLAMSYYILRIQVQCLYHGGKGLSRTLRSARSYRAAKMCSRVLRRALYGRGVRSAELRSNFAAEFDMDDEDLESEVMSVDGHNDVIKQFNTRVNLL